MNNRFVRWHVLLLEYVKRDVKIMVFWILGLGIFSGGFVPAFVEIGKGQGLAALYQTMKNPAMVAIAGPLPVNRAGDYTLGAVYGHEMLLFCSLFAMIITAIHVVNHTRKEEEQGLSEIVRSLRVGRFSNSFAVMVEMIGINLILGVFIGALMSAFRVETINPSGSFLFGLSIAIAGMMGGVMGLVFAQIMPTASGAKGVTLSVVGLLYILRGMSDVSNISYSKMNPMGWTYLTAPFTHNRWGYLGIAVGFTILSMVVAFILEEHRDMGAGYIPQQSGKDHAGAFLRGPMGLLLHLNRGALIGWMVGFATIGVAYGSIYGDMQAFLESNDFIRQMFTINHISLEVSFTASIMMVMVFMVSVLPIVVIAKLFTEESKGTLNQLYSTKVSRGKMFGLTILLASLAGLIGLMVSALSLGGSAMVAMGDKATLTMTDFVKSAVNGYAELLFFVGITAVLLGWIPQGIKVVYAYLGYAFALNYFGGILDLPQWLQNTSAFNWAANVPVEEFDVLSFAVVLVVALLLMGIGYIGYRRRDLREAI